MAEDKDKEVEVPVPREIKLAILLYIVGFLGLIVMLSNGVTFT